jgi:hypothetical protein
MPIGSAWHMLANNTFLIWDTIIMNQVKPCQALSTLEVSQTVNSSRKIERAESALSLSSSVGSTSISNNGVVDLLDISQSASCIVIKLQIIESELIIQQSATSNIKDANASSQLDIVSEIRVSAPIYVNAANKINLIENYDDFNDYLALYGITDITQVTDPEVYALMAEENQIRVYVNVNMVYNLTVNSILSISDISSLPIFIEANTHIHLLDTAYKTPYGVSISELTLTQTAVGLAGKGTLSNLSFTSTALVNLVKLLSATSTLNLLVGASQYTEQYCLDPITPNAPIKISRNSVLLSFPYDNPTLLIELNNPNLGDSLNITNLRINRRTRGGTLIIARDVNWPKSNKFNLTFTNVSATIFAQLLVFIKTSLGCPIKYTDYNNIERQVVLTTPGIDFSEDYTDYFSFTLELEEVE